VRQVCSIDIIYTFTLTLGVILIRSNSKILNVILILIELYNKPKVTVNIINFKSQVSKKLDKK